MSRISHMAQSPRRLVNFALMSIAVVFGMSPQGVMISLPYPYLNAWPLNLFDRLLVWPT